MKAKITEYDYSFHIDLEAETLEEASQLVRLVLLSKKELEGLHVNPEKNGIVGMNLAFEKSKAQTAKDWIGWWKS